MLKLIEPRLYQETILQRCINHNCLVVLPTGLGKTLCALMLTAHRLKQYPGTKVLFLAPTRPLVLQHKNYFAKHLDIDEEKIVAFTGNVSPEKRKLQWNKAELSLITILISKMLVY